MLTNEAWVNVRASLQMKFSAPLSIVKRSQAERIEQRQPVFGGVALRAAVLRRAVNQQACCQRCQTAVSACEHRHARLQPPAKARVRLVHTSPPAAPARPKPGSTGHRGCLTRLAATLASATVVSEAVSTLPQIQGFVGSHRQPSAQASMQSNPAFEPTAPGVSLYTAWQRGSAGVCGSTQR